MKRTVPVSERLFRYMTALEVAKAERLRYYVCLVCLAPDINGSEIDQSLAGRIARMTSTFTTARALGPCRIKATRCITRRAGI